MDGPTTAILLLGGHPSEKEDATDLGSHAKGLEIVTVIEMAKFEKALEGKASLCFGSVIVGLGTGERHTAPDGEARDAIIAAMRAEKNIISTFSLDISKDNGLAAIAKGNGLTITCPGQPTQRPPIAKLKEPLPCPVILAYGKGSRKALLQALGTSRGAVAWIATTAAGCMMGPDAGMKVEVLAGDFISGAIEMMLETVYKSRHPKAIVIECLGTLDDIITSPVTIGIVHGSRATHILKVPGSKRQASLIGAALGTKVEIVEAKKIQGIIKLP